MLPFLEKNSRLYFPAATTLRGTFPRSSMIRAMWSAHHHIHHRGNRQGSALQHAHTRPHNWLCGTETHIAALEHGTDRLADGQPLTLVVWMLMRTISQVQSQSNPISFNFTWLAWLSTRVHFFFVSYRHLWVPVLPALWPVLPLRLKNSREYFPESAKCLGIQPSSSMMWAMWSTEERGRNGGMGGGGEGKGKGRRMPKKRNR